MAGTRRCLRGSSVGHLPECSSEHPRSHSTHESDSSPRPVFAHFSLADIFFSFRVQGGSLALVVRQGTVGWGSGERLRSGRTAEVLTHACATHHLWHTRMSWWFPCGLAVLSTRLVSNGLFFFWFFLMIIPQPARPLFFLLGSTPMSNVSPGELPLHLFPSGE